MQRHVSAEREADWVRERASDGVTVQNVARIGYIAKGVVYGIVSWIALQAAFSAGEETTGSKGALAAIVSESSGHVLLVLVAIGLAAYAFWRFVQCFVDPEHKGTDLEGLATRDHYFASGIAYSSLVIWSANLVSSGGRGSGDEPDGGADSLAAGYAVGAGLAPLTVDRMIGESKKESLEEAIDRYGMWTVVVFRMSPVLSNDAISFVGGMLRMGFVRFLGATAVGILPLLVLIAYLGKSTDEMTTMLLWLSGVSALALVAYIVYDRR